MLDFRQYKIMTTAINPLNAELNPICHLLALLGGANIVVDSRLRVNAFKVKVKVKLTIQEATKA